MGLIPEEQLCFLSPAPSQGQQGGLPLRTCWRASLAEQGRGVMRTLS